MKFIDWLRSNITLKAILNLLDPRSKSINLKFLFVILAIMLVSLSTVLSVSYFNTKNTLTENTFTHLIAIRELKKNSVEAYFDRIRNQAVTFSESEMVVNAMKQFSEAYLQVTKDSLKFFENIDKVMIEASVKNYYQTNFLSQLDRNTDETGDIDRYWTSENATSILQYYYISENPNETGLKYLLDKAGDNSSYSDFHAKYHPVFRNYLERFGYSDIMLVDPFTGRIVYSVSKEVDFATSLITGPFSNTNIGEAFKSANSSTNPLYTKLVDFQAYTPSYGLPAGFVASPIFDGNEKIGVLIFKIQADEIRTLMTDDQTWEEKGMGETGESYLIASDFLMRSDARLMIENASGYFRILANQGVAEYKIEQLKQMESNVLIQEVKTESSMQALKGITGKNIITGYLGNKVFSAYSPLNIEGVTWSIITELGQDEVFRPLRNLRQTVIILSVILVFILMIISNLYINVFALRILKLKDSLALLTKGEVFERQRVTKLDEIGKTVESLNSLTDKIETASEFARQIGEGNFDMDFTAHSENDRLANSLSQMKNSLVKAKEEERARQEEDEKRNWITRGLAQFAEILRSDNDNLEKLSYNVIISLVKYLNANQAGVFILDDTDEKNIKLKQTASFAFDREKFLKKNIEIGEGLAGTVAKEKKTKYLTDVPEEYISITSGLGKASPRCLLIVPLQLEGEVFGVVEIASFNHFQKHEIEFVEKVAESIASTLSAVKMNIQTATLLEESRQRASEMAAQEEEMRQNLEELQTTQEALARKSQELERLKEQELFRLAQRESDLKRELDKKQHEIDMLLRKIEDARI